MRARLRGAADVPEAEPVSLRRAEYPDGDGRTEAPLLHLAGQCSPSLDTCQVTRSGPPQALSLSCDFLLGVKFGL
jgi:hypothetical protein